MSQSYIRPEQGGWTVSTGELSTTFRDETAAAAQIGLLQQEIERLRAIVDNLPLGVPIGVNDRHGNPIHIGDKLRFDGQEWGGPMEFVVSLAWGKIQHPGATSDLSNWCEIIEPWDATRATTDNGA